MSIRWGQDIVGRGPRMLVSTHCGHRRRTSVRDTRLLRLTRDRATRTAAGRRRGEAVSANDCDHHGDPGEWRSWRALRLRSRPTASDSRAHGGRCLRRRGARLRCRTALTAGFLHPFRTPGISYTPLAPRDSGHFPALADARGPRRTTTPNTPRTQPDQHFRANQGRSPKSGGSGIRTHGDLRHNGFRDRPIRPLSHPSGGQASGRPRRWAKKSARRAADSSAQTPGVTASSWLRRGSAHRL